MPAGIMTKNTTGKDEFSVLIRGKNHSKVPENSEPPFSRNQIKKEIVIP
jgi:hypothetical protein